MAAALFMVLAGLVFVTPASAETGTVKWFNLTKGYGFIIPDAGGNDAFVHVTAVRRAGLTTLQEGQKVQYELVPGRAGRMEVDSLVSLD